MSEKRASFEHEGLPEGEYFAATDNEGEPVFLDSDLTKPWLCDIHNVTLTLDSKRSPICLKCMNESLGYMRD
jgi:hypothetical protein